MLAQENYDGIIGIVLGIILCYNNIHMWHAT